MRSLFNALKRTVIGLATGQLVSGYSKDKNFKSKVDHAPWFNKLKVAREYLVDTNKKLINETDLDTTLESIKKTASQAQDQVKNIDKQQVIKDIKSSAKNVAFQAGQKRDDILTMLQEKLWAIETEVEDFETNAKDYVEETRTEYYRQIASKFALYKKTVTKYIIDWAISADKQFDLEKKIQFIADKLEKLKHKR